MRLYIISAMVFLTLFSCKGTKNIVNSTCIRNSNPMEVSWMKKAVDTHHSEQIIRFKGKVKQWAFLFSGKEKYLYDCNGKFLATGEDIIHFIDDAQKGVIIWVREYRND